MSIQKRKWEGRTTYRVRIYHKRRVISDCTFDSLGEARRFETDSKARLARGEFYDTRAAENTTLADALERYLREVSINKKGRGYSINQSQARQICMQPISRLSIARIRPADIARYRNARLESVGANTVRLELALISHLYTVAIEAWDMEYLQNPVRRSSRPSVAGTARDRRLVDDEEARLLDAAKAYNQRAHALILVAIETAMRRGELAALTWKDIDGNIARLTDTKNGESREVPLSSRALAALHSLPRQLHEKVNCAEGEWRLRQRGCPGACAREAPLGDERIFGLMDDAISTMMTRVCKRAGIENLRFHDLRHEATSRFFEKGLNPMQVAAITGHKTLQMLKRYTHLRAEDLAKMLG